MHTSSLENIQETVAEAAWEKRTGLRGKCPGILWDLSKLIQSTEVVSSTNDLLKTNKQLF